MPIPTRRRESYEEGTHGTVEVIGVGKSPLQRPELRIGEE